MSNLRMSIISEKGIEHTLKIKNDEDDDEESGKFVNYSGNKKIKSNKTLKISDKHSGLEFDNE